MKITSYSSHLVAALSAGALLIIPGMAQAHHNGGGGGGRSGMSMARPASIQRINVRRAGMDDRANHNINDDRGQLRGRRADDGIRHDAKDDRNWSLTT